MKNISFLHPPPLFVEIGQSLLWAVHENNGIELPLERQADGRLTAACKEKSIVALKNFVKAKSWQPRVSAWCAINARGVSLRRLSLPAGTKEEFHQRLLLQIEAEFPLTPDELAWGYQLLGMPSASGAMSKQELLIAAVKKEIVVDYHQLLRACGTEPIFTLAAWARGQLCPQSGDTFTLLDVGGSQSELTNFEKGIPTNSKIIFLGSENISHPTDAALNTLAQAIKPSVSGKRLFVCGNKISGEFAARLASALGNGWPCEPIESPAAEGVSAAVLGLKKITEQGGEPSLIIRVDQAGGAAASLASLDLKKWGLRVGALLLALLLLPFVEAILLKPHLAKKVAAFKTEATRLTVIDRELEFLRYLKSSQPPYLDALYIFSKSVPPGTKFDSLSVNSHGQVSLRCNFRDGQQVADFRTKLVGSGFFAIVTVEEQTPTPDRQHVSVRISAQEKPLVQLQALSVGPSAEEIAKDAKPAAAAPGIMQPGGAALPPMGSPISRKETK